MRASTDLHRQEAHQQPHHQARTEIDEVRLGAGNDHLADDAGDDGDTSTLEVGAARSVSAVVSLGPLSTEDVAVQLIVAPGARVAGAAGGQVIALRPGMGSVTLTSCSARAPLLVPVSV